MYRKIGQENETEEDSLTNLGGQEKEWGIRKRGCELGRLLPRWSPEGRCSSRSWNASTAKDARRQRE